MFRRNNGVAPIQSKKSLTERSIAPKPPLRTSVDPFPTIATKKADIKGPLIKKKIKRSIEANSMNESIHKRMCSYVDEMYEHKAAQLQMCSLRQAISGQSCPPRKYFDSLKISGQTFDILVADTNYGTISIDQINHWAVTNISRDYALSKMKINDNDILSIWVKKHKLLVETGQLKITVIPQLKILQDNLQEYIDNFELIEPEKYTVKQRNIIRWIASRQYQKQIIMHDASQYITAYNKLKLLFSNHSTLGSFPRRWNYKGVSLCWDISNMSATASQRTAWYLQELDFKNGGILRETYKNHIIAYNLEIGKHSFRYLVDGNDYDYKDIDEQIIAM